MLRLVTTAYWLVLILWIVLLFSAASVAMGVFGTLPRLPLSMEGTAGLPADTPVGRYAAGFVAEGAFRTLDRGTVLFAPLMVALLFLQRRLVDWPAPGWLNAIRVGSILLAATIGLVQAVGLAPGMDRDLRAYRAAVAAGDAETAAARSATFDAAHRWADPMLRTEGFLLLLAAGTSAWVLAPRRAPARGARQTPPMVGMR